MDEVRVMVVDDQRPFRAAAEAVVESMEGFVVVATAESGEEAVELADRVPVDLVLMDVVMPGIGGLDAARALTARPDAPVVVLVSTYDATEFGDDLHACGAAAYLDKSAFDPDQLRAVWVGERA